MADQSFEMELVIKAIDAFSKQFATLNSQLAATQQAQAKTTSATAGATQALNKFQGVIQNISQGNISGAFTSLAAAIPGVGTAVVAVTGVILALGAVLNKQVEDVRNTINSVDELTDRYNLTIGAANQLLHVSSIMSINTNALARTFRSMARHGLQPSIEGLIAAKEKLEAIQDPALKVVETYKLLGRGAVLLADFMKTSTAELEMWASRAKYLSSVTEAMTKDQDDFSRTMAYYIEIQKNANVAIYGSTLSWKQQIQVQMAANNTLLKLNRQVEAMVGNLTWEESSALRAGKSIDELARLQYLLNMANASGLPITMANIEALEASEVAVIGYSAATDEMAVKLLLAEASQAKMNTAIREFATHATTAAIAYNSALDSINQNLSSTIEDFLNKTALLAAGGASVVEAFGSLRGAAAEGMDPAQVQAYGTQLQGIQLALQANTGLMTDQEARKAAKDLGVNAQDMATYLGKSNEELAAMAGGISLTLRVKGSGDVGLIYAAVSLMGARPVVRSFSTGAPIIDKQPTKGGAQVQFGSYNLGGGVYRVGEGGEEGLVLSNGRAQVIPHWKWMGQRGAASQGFGFGGLAETGGYIAPKNTEYVEAAARIAQIGTPYYAGGSPGSLQQAGGGGGGGTAVVAAVAAQAAAAEVGAQMVAAVQSALPSSAALSVAVVAPVIAASARAEQASRETSALLTSILSVLRQQGNSGDTARAMSEAVVLAGQ